MFATMPPYNFDFDFQQLDTSAHMQSKPHYHPSVHSSPLTPRKHNTIVNPSQTIQSSPPRSHYDGNDQVPTQFTHNTAVFSSPTLPTTTTTTTTTTPPASRSHQSPYAQRYMTKLSNPLSHASGSYKTSSSPSARERRRDIYLSRIKRDRQDGRFKEKGEQLMRMEHVAERGRWGEWMERDAEGVFAGVIEGEDDNEVDVDVDTDIRALDEYISEEQAMEMAILENMGSRPSGMQDQYPGQSHVRSTDDGALYSDDEYEGIFMDLADLDQGMDMSSG